MDNETQKQSISDIRERDIVDYLSALGYQPSKVRNNDYWYLSPLRDEKTASFKVNRKLNRWYDHGMGQGGNLIDFGVLYYRCSVGKFIQKSTAGLFFHQPRRQTILLVKKEANIIILRDSPIISFSLTRYLEQRKIPLEIARQFCREVSYQLNDKTCYGIGFKNDSGGYEIRNPFFKISSSPKDYTTLKNGSNELIVFEGFIDFLSFKTIHQNQPGAENNFLILNSLSFFEKSKEFMEQHETIRLYLDRDAAGQNCSRKALALSNKYKDESGLYRNYKDLNDWLVNFGKGQKQKIGNRIG